MKRAAAGPGDTGFAALRVLVVEDETLVSFLIEDLLTELGCGQVLHACTVSDALKTLDGQRPDAAILDVNLGGEPVYPVALRLEAENVPIVFATGYGRDGLEPRWRERPVLQKPFDREALAAALTSGVQSRRR
jgi:CheY-like chemotaxis protein